MCQAAGWGYPRLTVPSPRPASSVNEILSPALLADAQQRGAGALAGIKGCLTLFISHSLIGFYHLLLHGAALT